MRQRQLAAQGGLHTIGAIYSGKMPGCGGRLPIRSIIAARFRSSAFGLLKDLHLSEVEPDLPTDQPVSNRMEASLFDYYGSDPLWGYSYFGADGLGAPWSGPGYLRRRAGVDHVDDDEGDPHLRSLAEVTGYHMHAVDGEIGHAENILVDDVNWDVRYVIVDTRNWWSGKHLLISPYAVKAVSRRDREIRVDVDRETVKSSPPWDPMAMIDQVYEKKPHNHYGWRSYGF